MHKDSEARPVPLPRHTLDLLIQYQAEAPEGVPYFFLTEDRYQIVVKRWRAIKKSGKQWQNSYMANNVLRDFRVHAKQAGLKFDGTFSIHTFRKSCAKNWADRLPANVVKYYLGHSDVKTTNQFYSIVDESHDKWARSAMDEMLDGPKTGEEKSGEIDTEQTLAPKDAGEMSATKKAAEAASSVTHALENICECPLAIEPMIFELTTSCMPCKR